MAEGGLPNAGTGGGGYVIYRAWILKSDLTTVDRDVLIAIIAELQAVIARLEKRIVQLEGQAKPANSRRMPGLKPNVPKPTGNPPRPKGPASQGRTALPAPA